MMKNKFVERIMMTVMIIMTATAFFSCKTSEHENETITEIQYIPVKPDYSDPTMWYSQLNDSTGNGADVFYVVATWEFDWTTANGLVSHYADAYNQTHRDHMGIEIKNIAEYMGENNNYYAPYYRHLTLNTWATQNEDSVKSRIQLAMSDVKEAFDYFLEHHNNNRPIIIAGFSQGGYATVELLKHIDDDTYKRLVAAYVMGYKVTAQDTLECKRIKEAKDSIDTGVTICYNSVKDVKYIVPIVSAPNVFCTNPVNWKTDDTPAILDDTVTVTKDLEHNVLVVKGYDASEYMPILGVFNVGDIHSGEPYLYKECLRKNIADRVKAWRSKQH